MAVQYDEHQLRVISRLQDRGLLPKSVPPHAIPPSALENATRQAMARGMLSPSDLTEAMRMATAQFTYAGGEGGGQPMMPPGVQQVPMPPQTPVKETAGKVSLESVVLADEKREEIKAAISQVDNNRLIFETWGFAEVFEKGTAVTLLFYGVPGTGKTLMAQAIANDLDAELKIYGMAEIGTSEPGGSERIIKKIFATAKDFFKVKKKHQVILFDECDALLYDRNKVGVILGAQINALLTEIERHEGVIIFTTNRIGTLDPALERRIAAKIEFPFPDIMQRKAIWERMIPSRAPIAGDVDFITLAGYELAGGNIKNAVLNAARMAAYRQHDAIAMDDFVTAAEKEVAGQDAFKKEASKYDVSLISKPGEEMTMGTDRKISIVNKMKQMVNPNADVNKK